MSGPITGASLRLDPLRPLTVTQPPVNPAVTPADPSVAPVPATSPAPIPVQLAALITLEDGTVIPIETAQLPAENEQPIDLSIQLRYLNLQELVDEHRGEMKTLEIKEADLAAFYLLDKIITGPLDDTFIKQLDRQVAAIDSRETRAALKFLIAQTLFKNNRIDVQQLKERLESLLREKVKDVRYYDFYAQLYVREGKALRAAETFARLLQLETGWSLPDNDLRIGAAGLIARVNDGALLNKFGDYLLLWANTQTHWRSQGELLPLAESCYRRALLVDNAPAAQAISRVKLGDVSLLLANVDQQKEEEKAAQAKIGQAIDFYQAAIDRDPENITFRLKLVDALLLRGQLQGSEDDLKRARTECYKVLSLDPRSSEAGIRLVPILNQLDEEDQALAVIDGLLEKRPDDAELYAMRGDLQAGNGKFDAALTAYRRAFELALKAPEPGLAYAAVFARWQKMKLQCRLQYAQLSARFSPNPLRLLVRLTGDLLYFANPVNMIIHAVKHKKPKYSKEQLAGFLAEMPQFEARTVNRYRQQSHDANFYLANAREFSVLRQNAAAQLAGSKKGLVEKELIDELKALERDYAAEAESNLEWLTSDYEWDKALAKKDRPALTALFQSTLENYFAVLVFSARPDIDPALKEGLAAKRKAVWSLAEDRFDDLLELAEDTNDLETAFACFRLVSQAGGMLDRLGPTVKEAKLDIAKQQERTAAFFRQAISSLIEIAAAKKDYATLLELAKDQEHLGRFALDSLDAAIETAIEDKERPALEQAAEFALYQARSGAKSQAQRGQYRKFALAALNGQLEILQAGPDDQPRLKAAIQLWRLGDYDAATAVFTENLSRATDQMIRLQLLLDLAYMSLARDDKEQAQTYFEKILAEVPGQADIEREIEYLHNSDIMPADIILESSPHFPHHALRATAILYGHWLEGDKPAAIEQGLRDLYEAGGYRLIVSHETTRSGILVVHLNEPTVKKIKIEKHRPNSLVPIETKDEAILRELGYFGFKTGDEIDEAKIAEALKVARLRLKTFDIVDWRVTVDDRSGEAKLEIEIAEKPPAFLKVGGGGGTMDAKVYLDGGINNLLGGGELLGGGVAYHWFYGEGFKSFSLLEGRLYYRDPHLFRLGQSYPVSFGINAERFGQRDLTTGGLEIMNGGAVDLGIQLSQYVGLHFSPSLHYVQNDAGANYLRNGFRISVDYDDRDDWLLPSEGQFATFYVQPGVYYGGMPAAGFIKAGIAAEKYFALPADFVLMFGAKGEIGYNVLGSDLFALGGNGYVRGAKNFAQYGPMISAGTVELRSPVWNIGEYGEYAKVQPYVFADIGAIFNFSGRTTFGWGVGGGVRLAIPFLGLLNVYYGFPAGIGFAVGSPAPQY